MHDIDEILLGAIKEESIYFYSHIRDYDDSRNIDIVIADNMYEKAFQYDLCEEQRQAINNLGNEFNNRNGTVLFAPEKDKITVVMISKPMLEGKDIDELHGTLIHELTHAHDFYDYVDYLEIEEHNLLFNSEFYNAFYNWTEFNARRTGYRRFVEYKFRKSWKQFKRNTDLLLENAQVNFSKGLNSGKTLYELMQAAGRYSVLDSLSQKISGNFAEDMLKDIVNEKEKNAMIRIYEYLVQNTEFSDFCNAIAEFERLLDGLS